MGISGDKYLLVNWAYSWDSVGLILSKIQLAEGN